MKCVIVIKITSSLQSLRNKRLSVTYTNFTWNAVKKTGT